MLLSDEKSPGENLLAFFDDESEQSIDDIKRQQDEEFGDFLRRHGQTEGKKQPTGQRAVVIIITAIV